jgi:outer membrane receptor for ferric coprogen and ferric-rhodotorulic acid
VARGFEVSGAMSYTDAQLEKDAPGLGGRKGDRIPAVPRLTFSTQARYQAPLFDGIDGYVQGDVQYVGNSYNNFNRATADEQPSYALANLKLGALQANWEANFFVTNLFDKRAFLFVDTTYGDKRVNVNRPRTIGVSLTGAF